jgi:hypothetical protein
MSATTIFTIRGKTMTGKTAALFLIFSMLSALIFFNISKAEADQGVYEKKCSTCHSLRKPEVYSKKQWDYHVKRMADRAGLTSAEIKSIIDLHTK